MSRVFLALGSNLGKRDFFLFLARQELQKLGQILLASSIYETQPLGDARAWFLNQVVLLETDLLPRALLAALKALEHQLGRRASARWGDREIDLDILFYETQVIDYPELQIPHREMHKRNFVLRPLAELAGDFLHPILGKTVSELLKSCPDNLQVNLWTPPK